MKFEHIMLALVGTALLAGVALVAQPEPAFDPAWAPAALPRPDAARAQTDADAAFERARAQRERTQLLAFGRDPFRAPAPVAPAGLASVDPAPGLESPPVPGSAPAHPILTGISSFDGVRWAIIDREIVREGQRLSSGFTVERIERGSVTLRREQEEVTLALGTQP